MSTATKKVTAKTQRFEIRMSPDLKALTERAAAIKQVTPSAFTAEVLRAAATAVVESTDIIRLSLADQQAFAKAIFNPPEPSSALRRAFERHAAMVVNRE